METDIIDIIDELPAEFRIVSIISVGMKIQAFTEYSNTFNIELLKDFDFDNFKIIEEDADKFVILSCYLPLALMFKNEKMQKYIYDIFQKAGYDATFENFIENINSVNKHATSIQFGGAKIMDFIYALGAIFLASFYNYYLYSIGSARIINVVERVRELSPLVQGACNTQYNPSYFVRIASRFTKDPSIMQEIEHIIQCSEMPTFFQTEIEEVENGKQIPLIMNEFQGNLLGMPEELKRLPAPPSQEEANSRELVIHGTDFEKLNEKLTRDLQDNGKVLENVRKFANLPPSEFKQLIEFSYTPPAPYPSPAPPTPRPVYQMARDAASEVVYFASDVIGAIQEVSPSGAVPSLDMKNIIAWTIQDKLRDFQRKIEDSQRETGRRAFDIVNELTRLGADIASIPSVLFYLFAVNSAALTAIIFLMKKLLGSKSVKKSSLQIEDITDQKGALVVRTSSNDTELATMLGKLSPLSTADERETGRGGRRRKRKTIRKLKRKTHKRGKKRKQTKAKKGRRFTRKY